MSFSERLKELRNNNHISQAKLAKDLNLGERTIRRYEANEIEPTMSVLIAMSGYFKASIDYIVGITDNNTIQQPIDFESMLPRPRRRRHPSIAAEEAATLEQAI